VKRVTVVRSDNATEPYRQGRRILHRTTRLDIAPKGVLDTLKAIQDASGLAYEVTAEKSTGLVNTFGQVCGSNRDFQSKGFAAKLLANLRTLGQPCEFQVMGDEAALQRRFPQVRKPPSWPRGWANFSLL
jgi:hypothetical protein